MKKTPVTFKNKNGLTLHGVLEQPVNELDKATAILFLSPGIKMRVAPHQLYNKMSRHFVGLGYTVLRFDFYGLGDSEGEVTEKMLADLYRSIQEGRYVDDTLSAVEWLSKEVNKNEFLLAGLCGGAITGLLSAEKDTRIHGLLGLGIPVILDGSNVDAANNITAGHMNRLQKGYVRKIFDPKSWMRLLTFQSDYRIIFNILKKNIRKRLIAPEAPSPTDINRVQINDNTNPLFAPAVFKMLERDAKINFIFSGSDRLDWEYEEKFVSRYKNELNQYEGEALSVCTIDDANHILSLPKWQKEMIDISTSWLSKNFNDNKV